VCETVSWKEVICYEEGVYNQSMTISSSVVFSMTEQIVRQFQPKQVILFGSLAQGEGQAESDVDLLVVFPTVPDKRKAAIQIRRALAHFDVPKDIIVTTPAEIKKFAAIKGSFLRSAVSEGRVLYERA
jgi:predicted nucleotidyltransferase